MLVETCSTHFCIVLLLTYFWGFNNVAAKVTSIMIKKKAASRTRLPPRDRFRKMAQRDKKQGQHFLTSLFWVAKHTVFLPDYRDIQRTAKINVPKETKIGCRSSLASQRIQKCARIRVNECEYTKNWKNVFADVCIFYFWRQLHLQIFVYFPSLLRPSA